MNITYVTTYRLVEGPTRVLDTGEGRLPGHYAAEFTSGHGASLLRFMTDKGRGELLRRIDAGQRAFSLAELEKLTVAPDLQALETRTEAESGEGA
jgi:hypothetical protein